MEQKYTSGIIAYFMPGKHLIKMPVKMIALVKEDRQRSAYIEVI